MIFVALELTSLSLYVLAAFNKRSSRSAEAALKYFLFGGVAAAFTLFGLSLIYGLSGELTLPEIAAALGGQGGNPLLMAALVMTLIGLGFKIAAAPFHLWAPDAYQGAPTPSAALIATGSKVAGFYMLARVMQEGFHGVEGIAGFGSFISGWVPTLALIAALSMIVGNVAAIVQNNVKRLLAYSAIAHAGYALLAIIANNGHGTVSLVYYVITYGLTTLGAFGVLSVVEDAEGQVRLSDLTGLSRRAPLLSFCMLIFMLSLAGIPPLAGFFGKFYVFAAAAGGGETELQLLWLVILAIAMSAVSLYYYLQVLKKIYVVEGPAGLPVLQSRVVSTVTVALLALLVIVLGAMPGLLVEPLSEMLRGGGH
jgi:NADH-quinone oxidoreductase subunit N